MQGAEFLRLSLFLWLEIVTATSGGGLWPRLVLVHDVGCIAALVPSARAMIGLPSKATGALLVACPQQHVNSGHCRLPTSEPEMMVSPLPPTCLRL